MQVSEQAGKVLEPVKGAVTRSRSSGEDHLWVDRDALAELAGADAQGRAGILCLEADRAAGLFPDAGAGAHGELVSHCLPQTCLALLELDGDRNKPQGGGGTLRSGPSTASPGLWPRTSARWGRPGAGRTTAASSRLPPRASTPRPGSEARKELAARGSALLRSAISLFYFY